MPNDPRRARDLRLLDFIDAFKREAVDQTVWRVVRDSRDPLSGTPSRSRWCDGSFDVLYTSFERSGALAEIYDVLNIQPVFPSRARYFVHRLRVSARRIIGLADLSTLEKLGVDASRYGDRDCTMTQPVAEAAHFLGFDGLIAPSARWNCLNAIYFTDRLAPDSLAMLDRDAEPVDWEKWRASKRHK